MAELFTRLGGMVLFSRKNRCVRRSIVFLLTNFLLIAGFVFALEVIVILLGVGDRYLPLTNATVRILSRILF